MWSRRRNSEEKLRSPMWARGRNSEEKLRSPIWSRGLPAMAAQRPSGPPKCGPSAREAGRQLKGAALLAQQIGGSRGEGGEALACRPFLV